VSPADTSSIRILCTASLTVASVASAAAYYKLPDTTRVDHKYEPLYKKLAE
jgi:hypothetical protein